jgi:hypothetical protein
MAKRLFYHNPTFTAQGYSATTLTDGTNMTMIGASATQMTDVLEVLISGRDTASVPCASQLCRSTSTIAATPAAFAAPTSDGPMIPATAALAAPVVVGVGWTTKPQASGVTTDAKLNLGLNTFGGIIRWNASPTQQWQLLGNATGFGCTILFNSSTSGGSNALADAHIMYETY